MRIIAGTAKGRKLSSPAGSGTRPMMDRAREALFSTISAAVPGSRVLDLFAGAGTLGLEALSRGAESAVFVERDRVALEALHTNVAAVGLGGRVIAGDAVKFVAQPSETFDLVFLDPPYAMELDAVGAILVGIVEKLAPGGVLVLHRPAGEERPEVPAGLEMVDERRYGGTCLRRYERISA